jgi:5'(3')-deoxyribonucleotidase
MKIVYIDMDDTLCDYRSAHQQALAANPSMNFPQAEYGFFSRLKSIENAIESVKQLLESSIYKPYILTAPSVENPLSYAEKRVWVECHLGMKMVDRLIISPDKSLLKGDYLIDNNIEGKGQDEFEGILIHFGSKMYPDWKSVINFLIPKT